VPVIAPLAGIAADGPRRRYSPQLSFYAGSFGLLGEYAWSQARVRRASDGQHFDYTSRAWQGAVVYVIGGTASFAGARPAKPFDPPHKQWGALELAARVHGLEMDRGTVRAGLIDTARTPRRIVAWTAAANWVLSRHLKQGINYEHATFGGGAAGGADRAPENIVFIRTQLSF
jgi:phosphate-selective porin OprO/OprP